VGPVAGEDEMGMRVDQARRDPAARAILNNLSVEVRSLGGGPGVDDPAIQGSDDSVRHLAEAGTREGGEAGVAPDAIAEHADPSVFPPPRLGRLADNV
jgi:hypothetical protein